MADGFNPMRWDCEKRGCFNKKKRPKVEVFHDLFPGKISFGDVDGIVEINGHALILEWKSYCGDLQGGQKIMYKRLTRICPIMVMVVSGDAESMEVEALAYFDNGKFYDFISTDINGVRSFISWWVRYSEQTWAMRECLNEKITLQEYINFNVMASN